jgi:hypothetical protein
MERGEQLVLIRKGGLIEPGSGFEVIAGTFVFYPTFEHQTVEYLRPNYRTHFEDAIGGRAPAGRIRMALCGVAVSSVQSRDPSVVERLRDAHVYNDAFLSQRLKWQPEQPLVIVLVRAFRLAEPLVVEALPRYAGCKSWVDLETPVPLEGARPVLDEAVFQARTEPLRRLLPGF